jgi:hypothetical protein
VVAGFGLLLAFVPLPGVAFDPVARAQTAELPDVGPVAADQLAAIRSVSDEPVGADRVTASEPDARQFSAVGVQFPEPPREPVFARVEESDGRFGDWHELHLDGGPDQGTAEARTASGRVATAPLMVGEGHGYEISLGRADLDDVSVVTVHEDRVRRVVSDATPLAASAPAAPFGIHPRGGWTARPATAVSYGTAVRMAVVHHSVSSNNYSPSDVPGILRSIQAYHMDGNGWADIGYNFVVDKYGQIWEAREGGIDRPVIGAHAMGFNTNSTGVMVLGDYSVARPTAASLEGAGMIVGWRLAIDGADPSGRVDVTSGGSDKFPAGTVANFPRVVGHQDTSSTGCPGTIQQQLPWIRSRATAWAALVPGVSPRGGFDSIRMDGKNVVVSGWAVDDDTTGPISVLVIVNGKWYVAPADRPYGEWAAKFEPLGPNHGYDVSALALPGRNDVCVVAMNIGGGQSVMLGCQSIVK